MSKSKSIPKFITISKLNQDQSLIAASQQVDRFNQGKRYGKRITSSHFNTLQVIIKDYCKKFRHKSAFGGKLHITVGNLAKFAKCCMKSVYNHINRLIESGFFKKSRAYHDFGSGASTLCIEIEINKEILIFQDIHISTPVENPLNTSIGIVPIMDPLMYEKLRNAGFVGG
jgi:hypothetical protein